MALWEQATQAPWAALWARYDEVLKAQQQKELVTLDAWYLDSLPAIVRAREPQPYTTQPELVKLMEWKLKKGKWRPQLMKFVTSLSDDDVKQASTEALRLIKNGDLRTATEALCTLKGVGPATASAVLAAYDGSVPFMADEALEAIAGIIGSRKYTLPHFLSFTKELRAKAKWLNEQRAANDEDSANEWTAQRVQLCLYAEAHDRNTPASSIDKTKKDAKRKRPTPAASAKKDDTIKPQNKQEQNSTTSDAAPVRRSLRKRQRATE